jgi:hypothetical protein
MKHRNLLLVPVAFLAGIGVSTVLPALAQQENAEDAWEIIVTPYGQQSWSAVKHNTKSGQTLVLSCNRGCEGKEAWLEFPVEVVD